MSTPGFKIYSASAGSGKTYQLTKSYLKLILNPNARQKYKQLLALTFTNKAVGEMKQRILQSLYHFTLPKNENKSIALFSEIQLAYNYTTDELRERSKSVLKQLLHNYAFFEIATIDKFNHRIIRTFARDLRLSQNFQVALDTESLLNEAIARVLNKAGLDHELTKVLIDFTFEKIDDDKSWNISHDLSQIGKILFQESHRPHTVALYEKSIVAFTNLKKSINLKLMDLTKEIEADAQAALEKIHEMGFEADDFPRETLPNHFKKLIAGESNPKTLYANKLEENLINDKILKASAGKSSTELSILLLEHYLEIKKRIYTGKFYRNAYKNILSLTLINEISKEVKNIQTEKNLLSISEFNSIISNEIKDQPVPFIYERLGERYKHYFIDEFQDTSQMQWENLIPLIGNALESEDEKGEIGSLLLVGDVKQAIYRWRGGEAQQFLQLLSNRDYPFAIRPSVNTLEKNWRSYSQVVAFNNAFFSFAAQTLGSPDYQALFELGNRQQSNAQIGGYVEVCFLPEEKESEIHPHCLKTHHLIQEILSKGFEYGDITVLVRNNRQGVTIADFLAQQHIPIVSSEALMLKNNHEVAFLITLLYLIIDLGQKEYRFKILEYLSENTGTDHDFIFKNLSRLEKLLLVDYGFDLSAIQLLATYDIIELAILRFDLVQDSNAYINYFLDEVFEFCQQESVAVHDFLLHWEQKKDKLAIVSPTTINAVSIMTIHKSKGLEFPFVIFPFADSKINDSAKTNAVWVPVDPNEFHGFNEVMVRASEEIGYYSEEANRLYLEEKEKSELDDFNVLYVALTRAIHGLFIVSNESKTTKQVSYGSLFKSYLEFGKYWDPSKTTYQFGKILPNNKTVEDQTSELTIPYIYTSKPYTDFNMVKSALSSWQDDTLEAVAKGNLLHLALSKIIDENDIEPSLTALIASGELNIALRETYKGLLVAIVTHPKLRPYFSQKSKVYNEVEILSSTGEVFRLDRLILNNDQAIIIDYKTGKPSKSHINQVQEYAAIVSEMGYFVTDKILVYIDESVNPIFV
ncbi:UvrD-helicase domain-containing protein [Croceitalea sp. MTPC5]|uniref:UvrD-helicase domain-containing protein n=1 Tax=Croceitalea sp. MTPC5 TaxID=3056565 RepID=UPI002B3C6B84|nr:UvrD-helicase domain-containing protein [Croceitalea sp. MTPC5]